MEGASAAQDGSQDSRATRPGIPRTSPLRLLVAGALHRTGLSALGRRLLRWGHGCASIRAVNYHQTLPENAENFEAHLRWYAKHFVSVAEHDLTAVLKGCPWPHRRPGLLISFDDGLRSNAEIAAPLLERYGMRGWYFVPTAFTDCPPAEQRAFAQAHGIPGAAMEAEAEDGRVAASWDQLRALCGRGHAVGVHTATHMRLGPGSSPSDLEREIFRAKSVAESRLSGPVSSFCWVGGESTAYSREAAEAVARAGFTLGFQTNGGLTTARTDPLQVNRVNVEDRWPLALASFQVSGAMDLLYASQRRRISELTRTRESRS